MTNGAIKSPVNDGKKAALPTPRKMTSARQQTAATRGVNDAPHHTGITTRAIMSIPETPVSDNAGISKTSNHHSPPEKNHSQTGARGFHP